MTEDKQHISGGDMDSNKMAHEGNNEPGPPSLANSPQVWCKVKGFMLTLRDILNSILAHFSSDPGDEREGAIRADIRDTFASFSFTKMVVGGGVFVLLVYFLSGIFVVNPGERAVVKLFGKPVAREIEEGIHYRLPWPFQTVDIVNVSSIRREGIGLVLPEHEGLHSSPRVIQFLTGDNNIVDIEAVVLYRIKDAAAYLYNINYPAYKMINEVLRSSITEIGGSTDIDDILTIGKERLQEMIRIKTQNILDRYGSGLQLVGINLNKVYPPQEVAQSFQDVSNARQDQEKMVNDSMGYRNTIIPQARGEAENISRQAEGYRAEAINTARGEAGRFEQMLAEYNKDRLKYTEDVTKTRLYLESMEKVMAKVKNIIVNPEENGELNLRILVK
jgi:membrane protease subunit HflK